MKSKKIAAINIGSATKSLLAAITMAVCAVCAFSAQQQNKTTKSAPPPPNNRFEYMSKELSLTADQKPKVKAIVEAQMGEWETLEKNKTLNGKQKIALMQEINQTAQSKIEKILTAEQNKKLKAIMDAGKPQPGKPATNRKKKTSPGSGEP